MEETKVVHKKKVVVPKLRFREFSDEWKKEKLETKVNSISSGKIKPTENGDVLVYGSTGVIGKAEEYSHDGDYILVARVGANAGFINRVNGKFAVTDNTLVIDLKKETDVSFCQAYLTNYNLNKLIFGSGQPLITGGLLKALEFTYPTFPEQQKIASFLSAVDKKIQLLNRKKQLLEQYKKGVMQQLFSGKLRFKDENGKAYPKWEEKKLGEIAENIKSGKSKNIENGEFPLYGSTGVIGNCEEFSHDGKFILIARVGANAGTINLAEGKFGVSDNTLVVSNNKDSYLKFIYFYLGFYNLNKLIFGTGQPLITGGHLKELLIKFPSLEEQNKIADFLSAIDVKIENLSKQISQTQNFKKGLLQQMFV